MAQQAATLQSTDGQQVPLLGVSAKGRVTGLLFELAVEQHYANRGATNIEAVYTFPLPHGAELLELEVQLGERRLQGVVVERKQAEEQYEEAIDKGDTAIMLERAGSGLYTLNLGNLMAGETATIRYRYAQLLRFVQGSVRVTVPTVIAPRYGNSASDGMLPHQAPINELTAEYPFALELHLDSSVAAGTLASPSHAITTQPPAEGVRVTLQAPATLDRDFVLSIAGLAGHSLASVARDGDGYVALVSICPDLPAATEVLPLRLKLMLDCSGSMAGDSIDAARRALHRILESLTPVDRFSFSRFGSTVCHDVPALTGADDGAIGAAARLLGRVDADMGGTEMEAALEEVFRIGGAEGAADVLLITDGNIWQVDALIATARTAGQRVFVVGVGSAPAESVLRQLAAATGGACEFVASGEDAEAAIVRTFARLRSPRVERTEIKWPAAAEWVTALPAGLFGGETLHAYAGFSTMPVGSSSLHLYAVAGDEPLSSTALLPLTADSNPTIPRMAAAMRAATAGPDERLALALNYSLITERTNLLVVHERAEGEKAAMLPQLRKVSQMAPAGWGGMGVVMCRSRPIFNPLALDLAMPVLSPPVATIEGFLLAIDGRYLELGADAMPVTLAQLQTMDIPGAVLAQLQALVDEGHEEKTVVHAFLHSLADRAREFGMDRHLVRWMRGIATNLSVDAALDARMERFENALDDVAMRY